MSTNDQWHHRWETSNIGFHREKPNALLTEHWQTFGLPEGTEVFVPLCGKTIDMLWLLEAGYNVIGCELSNIAVKAFFDENKMIYDVTDHGEYQAYTAKNITLYAGDIFKLPLSVFKNTKAIYDRAALIAMNAEQRTPYTQLFFDIAAAQSDFKILLVTVEYEGPDDFGPPYFIDEKAVHGYFDEHFTVERLGTCEETLAGKRFDDAGVTGARAAGYLLVKR